MKVSLACSRNSEQTFVARAESERAKAEGREERKVDVAGVLPGELLEIRGRILPFILNDIRSQFKVLSRGVT